MKQIVGVKKTKKMEDNCGLKKRKVKVGCRAAIFFKNIFLCYVLDEFEYLQRSSQRQAQKERRIIEVCSH